MDRLQSFWALLSNYRTLYAVAGMSLAAGLLHLSNGKNVLGVLVLTQFALLATLAGKADKVSGQTKTREPAVIVFDGAHATHFTVH